MKQIDSIIGKIIRGFYIYNDVILGLILSLVSAYMFYLSFSIKIMKEPVSAVDTGKFFPQLVFGAMIPTGIALICMGIAKVKARKETAPAGEKLDDSVLGFKRGVIALASIAIFIALMEPLGFIPAAIIYMIFSMFFMSMKEGWKPVAYVITAIVVAVACYFLFKQFVYVRLPLGILKGVIG